MTLPCIRCGKGLEPAFRRRYEPEDATPPVNQPAGGTMFVSYGQYGSTVFDPEGRSGREFLEINVCDECMLLAASQGCILHALPERQAPPPPEMEPWAPALVWCARCGAVWPPHERHDDEPPW